MGVAGAFVLAGAVVIGPPPVVAAPGTSPRIAIPTTGGDLSPVLSDDGTVVVFVNEAADGTDRVAIHDRRTSDTEPITGSEGAVSPGVSGNGCTIAWSAATVVPPTTTSSTTSSSTTTTQSTTQPTTQPTSQPSTPTTSSSSSSTSVTSSSSPSSSDATVATGSAVPLRAPEPSAQTWKLLVADRCGGGDPVVSEIASGLAFGPFGRPALSLDGDTIVVSGGAELVRFDRTDTGFDQRTVAPGGVEPGARFGPVVDVSDDGAVMVFSAGPDPANPAEMSVYRTETAAGDATMVSGSAHHPSVSGDGSIVAYATVASASTVVVRAGEAAPVVLDNGTRPLVSADGNHVVYESGSSVRITAWTGDGTTPFEETGTVALTGPTAPTASGPTIDRFGATVATDTAQSGDIEIFDLPADAGFETTTSEVSAPSADSPLTAALRFVNRGPSSVGVASIVAGGALTIVGEDCSPVVRPESTCTIDVSFADTAAAEAGGTVTLTPIGIFPAPYAVEVRGVASTTTTTTTTPTPTNPPSTNRPPVSRPPGSRPTTDSSFDFPGRSPSSTPRFPSSASTFTPSGSSSSGTSLLSRDVAFVPETFSFTVDDADGDTGRFTGILELVNSSSSSVEVVGVRRETAEAVAFDIDSTTCTGAVLSAAGRCRVTVSYVPDAGGPQRAQLVATLGDGSEVTAILNGLEIDPKLTIWPDTATTSQVVTVSASGFQPDTQVRLEWAGTAREVQVDAQGAFAVPVVVPSRARTGSIEAAVIAPDGWPDDVGATMLVTAATSRNGPAVLEGAGPEVAG